MQVINLRKVTGKGKLKAFFDVEFSNLTIKDLKLVESDTGLWAACPSRSYQNKEGRTKYSPLVVITDAGLLDRISKEAAAIYHDNG